MSNDAQEVGAEVVANAEESHELRAKFEDVCRELNMDRQTEELAYKMLLEVFSRFSLEGEPMHWICCSLYAACRQSVTPTVSSQDIVVRGNCVSLNNLLRCCQMSIFEFKTKIKQWCYNANLPERFIHQIEDLERKFSITFTLYKNYRSKFEQVFLCPPKEKKHSKYSLHSTHAHKCSYIKLDDMCWRLFLCAKNQEPTTTVDLVTSFNLMICCIDLIYANVLAEKCTDLINPDFNGVPANWNSPEFGEVQAGEHCILENFCEIADEAKTMKATLFKETMRTFFQSNTIHGNKETLLGLVAKENFERNLKSLNQSYEQYVLSVGEFDERILAAYPLDASDHTNLNEQALRPPVTPLTRKQDLPAQPGIAEKKFEPVANATNNVKQLNALSRIVEPTDFVKQIGEEDIAKILAMIDQMQQKFIAKYPILNEAKTRYRLAKSLYFYLLDQILRAEKANKPNMDLKGLLVQSCFNTTLMTCCMELVLEAYNTDLKFPWILDCFSINAFEFHKIIEIVVRHGSRESRLTRALIKHLNSIEETCLERLAWDRNSPVWEMISRANKPLPKSNDVNNDRTAGALQIFLRKVYLLGWLRIQKLCTELNLYDNSSNKPEKIWTIFEHSITHKTELMQDRHLDQIIMCAIYIYIRVTKMSDPKFSDIMRAYRNQPQAVNSVYREVLISVKENGERKVGDIILFYNKIYVGEMTQFSINYLHETVDRADLLLSPHPIERSALPKKLTQNHALYVSQMPKNGKDEIQQTPNPIVYEFYRSPAKDLQLMNEKVRGGKRVLRFGGDDIGLGVLEQKRARDLPSHMSQLKTVMDDRENERK